MPARNVTDEQATYRKLVGDGADTAAGSRIVASRIGHGPYHSDDPAHRAAVDCNALRCELHALAEATDEPRLRLVARVLDVAADDLDDYASAAGL